MSSKLWWIGAILVIATVWLIGLRPGGPSVISAEGPGTDPFGEPTVAKDPFAAEAAAPAAVDPFGAPTASSPAKSEPAKPAPPEPPKETSGTEHRSGEEAILKALAEDTEFAFIETPLRDVVDFLRESHRIHIEIDTRALDDVGIGTDTPITGNLSKIMLRSALELALRELDLTWTIHNQVLLITTPEQDRMLMVTKVYDVEDLVVFRDQTGQLWDDYETLTNVITNTIEPTTWDEVGGSGHVSDASLGTAKALVILQTYRMQERVADLLEQLRNNMKKSADGQPPRKDRNLPTPMQGFGGMGSVWGPKCIHPGPPAIDGDGAKGKGQGIF